MKNQPDKEPDAASLRGHVRCGRPQVDSDLSDPLRPAGDATTLQYGQHVLLPRLTERQPIERWRLLQPGPSLLIPTQGKSHDSPL